VDAGFGGSPFGRFVGFLFGFRFGDFFFALGRFFRGRAAAGRWQLRVADDFRGQRGVFGDAFAGGGRRAGAGPAFVAGLRFGPGFPASFATGRGGFGRGRERAVFDRRFQGRALGRFPVFRRRGDADRQCEGDGEDAGSGDRAELAGVGGHQL